MQEQQSMNELIKNNPLELFDEMFNVKLLNDIVENFTSDGEKCFINKFYMYLNYENKPDFVIDLNDIWELLGVNQKVSIVRLLEKSFKNSSARDSNKVPCSSYLYDALKGRRRFLPTLVTNSNKNSFIFCLYL